jgi:branched-chain amino acid aminotransferase
MANAWLDGRLITGPIPLDPFDRGLTLGDGLFETIAVFNARPAYLRAHLDRLEAGAKALAIDLSVAYIESGIAQLLAGGDPPNAILRITVTRGSGLRGLAGSGSQATLLMTLVPWQKATVNVPVRLATSAILRNQHSPSSSIKTLSYVDNVLAARDAAKAGADDALMLNTAGRIACTTIANLFAINGTKLMTPPPSEGVLPGIIRGRVLTLADSLGLSPEERPMTLADLASAAAVFLTNSIRLVRPVTEIDGYRLPETGNGRIGSVFSGLCDEIARELGTLDLSNL